MHEPSDPGVLNCNGLKDAIDWAVDRAKWLERLPPSFIRGRSAANKSLNLTTAALLFRAARNRCSGLDKLFGSTESD